jgi:DNA-binding beta-propeller fold protein YncE
MIPETLQATTIIPGDTLIVEEVGGEQVPVDYLLSHTGMLTVDPLIDLEEGKTYRVTLQDISDAVGNLMEPYSFEFSTQRGTNNPPAFDSLTLVSESIIEPGQAVTINAFATDVDGDFIEYRFRIGEEQYSEWSNVATFSQVLEEEGNYTVTAQARDSFESVVASNVNFAVVAPTAALVKSISSGPMALNAQGDGLWVVNPDNLGIAHISVPDMELVREPRRRRKPVSIGIDQDGDRWVVYEAKDNIELVNRFGGSFHTIQFNYGANPSAIVMDTQNAVAYVALEGSGEIVKIDTESREEIARVSNVKGVHALALSGDREHLLGTRFISPQSHGEVYAVNPNTMRLERTIILEQSLTDDNINAGRGVPNYIAHIAIDGNSRFAYAVGKKDNVGRGLLNGNEDLDEDNTVRTFISVIDLDSMRELKGARVDIDNTDSPSAVTFSRNEEQLFVALQGNNLVAIFDRDTDSGTLGASVAGNFSVGLAPQGLLLNQSGDKLYVKNFTDRTVSQIDLTAFNAGNRVNPTISTTRSVRERDEMLSEQELLGKQIFYNASFGLDDTGEFTGRTSAEGYLSCASCHFDGGEDGRVYDFTGRGEGLRNNLTLNGRGGDDETLLHWSGNFDEVQDFENDIRHQFLGRGLMTDADFSSAESPLGASKAGLSEDLDALAAYVNSLKKSSVKKSQYRQADGSMTASAVAGHDVYVELNCQSCHYRFLFSDKLTHDVGTLRDHSGSRAGEVLEALRTPFLLGLFDSAPYMHDGSAETVEEIFVTVGGNVIQAEDMQLANGAQTVNANGFSYYRQAQAVTAPSGGMVSVIEESDSDRTAYIRVRYGSAPQSANLVVEVNGRQYEQSLLSQAKTEGKDVAFAEAKFVVEMSAGSNSINIWPEIASGQALIIDDITISTPQHESAADVHTRVNQLSAQQKSQLMDYLMQIDQGQNVPR